ncbi:hypothetical protein ILYODFUR_017500 [Ilyodon furcidens]|uniref:C2H2-type domain-containing protein n=1 Tax=Ilyodon furcidens TaxID=33524 RepID=A0ABV0UV38_9TELE
MKAKTDEDCGGAESSRNSDLCVRAQLASSSETEVSDDQEREEDDMNHPESQLEHLSDSWSKTEERENEWKAEQVNKSSCSECDKLVNKCSRQRHIKGRSKKRSTSCLVNEEGSREKDLTSLKCLSCDDCGKCFNTQKYLNIHMRIHGDKAVVCDVCGERFNLKSYLNTHMRIHTGNVKRVEWPSKGWPQRLTQGTLFHYFPALTDRGEPGTEERPS